MRKRLARSGLSDEEAGEAWNRVLLLAVRERLAASSFASEEHQERWAMQCAWRQRGFQIVARRQPSLRLFFQDEATIQDVEVSGTGRVLACDFRNEFGEVQRLDGWRAELASAMDRLTPKRRAAVEARVLRDVQDVEGRQQLGSAYWANCRHGLAVLRHSLVGSECELRASGSAAGPLPQHPAERLRQQRADARRSRSPTEVA